MGYGKGREEKRLKLIQQYTELSKEMGRANNKLKEYVSGNNYFALSQMEDWKNQYEPLNKEYKNAGNWSKLNLDNQVVDSIKEFGKYYSSLPSLRTTYNQNFVTSEKIKYEELFDNIEGRALDNQQRECVVKNEANNLVIAGAGTGKTTTIVGKVKYLIAKGYKRKPDELLVLSFTNASAKEMAERIKKETNQDIDVMTFHKLGKEIIAEVEGKQPSITGINLNDFITEKFFRFIKTKEYLHLVNDFFFAYLKEYKNRFDFKNEGEHIAYLKNCRIKTLRNETVKSFEEMEIANFLTLNGIKYEYERYYEVDTADKRYGKYRPDFYLPEYAIYVEHFGIDRHGNVPSFFTGDGQLSAKEKYNQGIQWKRELHKQHKTILVETYTYEKIEGVLTENLRKKLVTQGVQFKPFCEEDSLKLIENDDNKVLDSLVSLMNTFIVLLKANGYTTDQITEKNRQNNDGYERKRNEAFIRLVAPIYTEYIKQLEQNQEIDFSDMINKASDYIFGGSYNKKYTYIIVDEYQDISLPRYKLIKAIKDRNQAKLFCVGDDWQSIYRFAGSEIDLFTRFDHYFGYTERSYIETTYRFNSSLIEMSSRFILKNKVQIAKTLKSPNLDIGRAFDFICADNKRVLASLLKEKLIALPPKSSIILLGRYRDDIKFVLGSGLTSKYYHHENKHIVTYEPRKDLKIEFLTVHKSKGLQADYVFILNNTTGKYGFPSDIVDDKVLHLLIQAKELFEHAEERRLFYVALTRAKKHVFLLVENRNKSVFIEELEKDNFTITETSSIRRCPQCKTGELLIRSGRYGDFYGCSNYPLCEHTEKLDIKDSTIL
jgi:DNA helicase-4